MMLLIAVIVVIIVVVVVIVVLVMMANSSDGVCVAVAESIRCPSYQERVRREKKTIYRCVDVCIRWPRNITLARDRSSARGIYK